LTVGIIYSNILRRYIVAFDPVTALLDFGGKVIDKFVPDATQAAAAKATLAQEEMTGEIQITLGQLAVNANEAKSESIFVAGWRPWVGWVCGAGLAYAAIILPIMEFFSKVVFNYTGDFPKIDWALLSQVLIGMLGLGAMRSYDKKNGNGNGH
jgi:hypothetical protein